MTVNLPTELLRSAIAIVETGSMIRAAEHVHLTPSAISLQVKRLESRLGTRLFDRDGRKIALTPAGETLLHYARSMLSINDRAVNALMGKRAMGAVRIGVIQDFAETLLSQTLRRFVALNPEAQIQVKVAGSQDLKEAVDGGRLDVVLFLSVAPVETVVATRPVLWFGSPSLLERDVLPLALLDRPCAFREQALAALERAGIPFQIAIETSNVSALRAAVSAGLGVTSRIPSLGGAETQNLTDRLPQLPDIHCCLRFSNPPSDAVRTICEFICASLSDL